MGILTSIFSKFRQQKVQSGSGINPSTPQPLTQVQAPQPSGQGQSPSSSALTPSQSNTKKTLAQLEAELAAPTLKTYPIPQSSHNWRSLQKKLIWTTVLVGIPLGIVYVVNLPYPFIRQPIAEKAPLLLLPSYIGMDSNFKQGQAKLEQARQLVANPTSAEDLDLGEKKLIEAKQHLDALPVALGRDWGASGQYYWWYSWRLSPAGLQESRIQAGELEAKVFQEKNAQTLFTTNDRSYQQAKSQYQQAKTPTDKRIAIANWQAAIDQLNQVPSITLAGRGAQQKLIAYQRDFQETVGLAAGNQKVNALITAAREFSRKAAQSGQNPPHSVAKWTEVENLWQNAISRLEKISPEDLDGYTEAQRLLAEHQLSLGEVIVRRKAEAASVEALANAQKRIADLLATTPVDAKSVDRNRTISQLQSIMNELNQVQKGTTPYLEAQELKLNAQNKLKQLQSQ